MSRVQWDGSGGLRPPEAKGFYSAKIKLELVESIKMDSDNWNTWEYGLYIDGTLFGNSDSCSPPIFSKDKRMNNTFELQ